MNRSPNGSGIWHLALTDGLTDLPECMIFFVDSVDSLPVVTIHFVLFLIQLLPSSLSLEVLFYPLGLLLELGMSTLLYCHYTKYYQYSYNIV